MGSGTTPRTSSQQARSDSLLEALARRYTGPLRTYFSRRVRNPADVPDLVQDVLLRLARIEDLSKVEKPEHYIFRTASSALRDRARGDVTHCRNSHIEFDPEQHGGSDFSAERVLMGKEAVTIVSDAVRLLPVRTRDVFMLRVFEEQKTATVAQALGISTRAVESHYSKALAAVAAALRDYRND